MAEDDVMYTDVKFNRPRAEDEAPGAEVVYSNVTMPRTKHPVCSKCAIDAQQAGQGIRSKVTTERVVLLVIIGILVVTIIALAVKINSKLKMDTANSRLTCPPPPEAKNLTCLKCEAGWEQHGGNCYYFSTSKSSWTDSRRSCTDLGSDLVKIDSREEQVFLIGRVRDLMKDNQDKFWIGLTDSKEEGKWLWMDGSALDQSLSFWNQTQPDNKSPAHSAEADCVRMGKKEKKGGSDDLKSWFDTSCKRPQKSICEKTAKLSSSV
ncbi:hepatic lectin-like isoform X1 [Poecilia latipinna]|uniref:hepatic lectin-like isoform X1 n=1 Tax=Poecilia latipinna TaxID=48699 RepID=UPI00072E93B5|nr:PREDICTED: hepatic lectin-like isoform X1 [Poecilia latipinna]XP_014901904.1 PREDICTED: hepatic lectin-like isoform X1 [Poecilia latipinna]XP_014901911.1 PREDICTED: hepatic lectin-like isoform X1 [Poecilia latipinna]